VKILALRTDKPQAELYIYEDDKKLAEINWQAHLKLAETLNTKIDEILKESSISYEDLNGVAVYEGPGSFTGLRIGISTANALAYGLGIPIVASAGDNWLEASIESLQNGKTTKLLRLNTVRRLGPLSPASSYNYRKCGIIYSDFESKFWDKSDLIFTNI
jgi:tRNA threonylcarbamoyladenosine biosynthesis protein TsaB